MTHTLIKLATLTAIANLGFAAHAQNVPRALDGEGSGWSFGAGVAYSTTVLEDEDDLILPFPYIAYDKGRFHAGIDGISYDVLASDMFNVEVKADFRDNSLSGDDLEDKFPTIDRGLAIEAGIASELSLGSFSLGAELMHDISGEHDGMEATLSASYGTMFDRFLVSAGGGAIWQDEDLSLYQYGVKPTEATDTLSAFAPEASWTPYAEIMAGWVLSERDMILGVVSHEFLPDEITDSPLVHEDSQTSAVIMFIREF